MAQAIDETNRRREKQVAYNTERGLDPQPLRKRISDITELIAREDADTEQLIGGGGRQQSRGKAPVPGFASRPGEAGRGAAVRELPRAQLADLIQQLNDQMRRPRPASCSSSSPPGCATRSPSSRRSCAAWTRRGSGDLGGARRPRARQAGSLG